MRTSDLFRLSCGVSTENYISQEYNAFDWNRAFFGMFNQLSRAMSAGSTTINNPAIITYMVTGGLTQLGKLLTKNVVDDLLQKFGFTDPELKGSGYRTDKDDSNYDHVVSTYKIMFLSPKKINFESDYDKYVGYVNNYIKGVQYIKQYVCDKIPQRNLTLGEKNTLKLLRPKEILEDMKSAQTIMTKKTSSNPQLMKKWEGLYKKMEDATNDLLKYVLDNIKTDLVKQ